MTVLCVRIADWTSNTVRESKCPCRIAETAEKSYSMPSKSSVAGAVVNSMVKRRDDLGSGKENRGDSGSVGEGTGDQEDPGCGRTPKIALLL